MKRFSFVRLSIAALALTGLFAACGETTTDPELLNPNIVLSGSGGCITSDTLTLDINSDICFDITVTKGNEGKDLKIFKVTYTTSISSSISQELVSEDFSRNQETYNWTWSGRASSVADVIDTYTIYVEDRDGNSSTEVVKVTSKEPTGPPPIPTPKFAEGLIFSSVFNGDTYDANTGNEFTATSKTTVSTLTRSQALAIAGQVNLSYFYSKSTTTHNMISPAQRATYDGNVYDLESDFNVSTELRSTLLTSGDFDAQKELDEAGLEDAFDAGSPVVAVGNPDGTRFNVGFEAGAVVAFKTGDYHGLIKIVSVSATAVEVDVLVQK